MCRVTIKIGKAFLLIFQWFSICHKSIGWQQECSHLKLILSNDLWGFGAGVMLQMYLGTETLHSVFWSVVVFCTALCLLQGVVSSMSKRFLGQTIALFLSSEIRPRGLWRMNPTEPRERALSMQVHYTAREEKTCGMGRPRRMRNKNMCGGVWGNRRMVVG